MESKVEKKNLLSAKIDKFDSLDPRSQGYKLIEKFLPVMIKAISWAEESESVSDVSRLGQLIIKFQQTVLHDPARLIEQVSNMSDNDKTIVMSLLSKDDMLISFKERNIRSKKLFQC